MPIDNWSLEKFSSLRLYCECMGTATGKPHLIGKSGFLYCDESFLPVAYAVRAMECYEIFFNGTSVFGPLESVEWSAYCALFEDEDFDCESECED